MNRPTGLEFGTHKKRFLLWELTYKTVGWEYSEYITTKDILIDIKYIGFHFTVKGIK